MLALRFARRHSEQGNNMHLNSLLAADNNGLIVGIAVFIGWRFWWSSWSWPGSSICGFSKFTGVGISMGKLIMMSIRK